MILNHATKLQGEVLIPGDKSISHRAVMLGAIAKGITVIRNFLPSDDCLVTIACLRCMGADISVLHPQQNDMVRIVGKGLSGLSKPTRALFTGNSGTTTRLLSGILAGQNFQTTLTGDDSLHSRPMGRIIYPLTLMGASIQSMYNNDCAPLLITPHHLHGINYHSTVASAQVKSAILFAGLYADEQTIFTEPAHSRNHTELMLDTFGADIQTDCLVTKISPFKQLKGQELHIPGDISSAAFFIAAGLMVPNSELMIKNVGINPTRSGFLSVCKEMGGDITLYNQRCLNGEPSADLLVRSSNLHGATVEGTIIPTLIDELPVIALLAAFASGITIIKDATELKVKESNRILTTTHNLQAMGAAIIATEDGMIISGGCPLHGATINSLGDHRIAMTFSIAALIADGNTTILGGQCVSISFPGFFSTLSSLIK